MVVTLIDGREVSSDSEEWRHECEARAVCKMRGYIHTDKATGRRSPVSAKSVRHRYMIAVAEKRGQPAADALRDLVLRIWNDEFREQA